MLIIRLSRTGRKHYPFFRVIVSEKSKDTLGDYLENLGNYNPRTKECNLVKERILYWISKGAKLSPTIHNLFVGQNIINSPKIKVSRPKRLQKGDLAAPPAKSAENLVIEAKK